MDEHLNQLKYLLMFLIRRIEEGNRVRWPEKWDEITRTKAFAAAGNLLKRLLRFPLSDPVFSREQAYIALLLLTGNIFSQADQPMHELAEKMIGRFEQIGCLYFSEKEQLASMIAMHLDPAYYRIKYGLTLPNPLKNIILEEHEALHFLVKKCAVPFEEKVGKPIPEDELAYLTMHFGGWLRRQGLELYQPAESGGGLPQRNCHFQFADPRAQGFVSGYPVFGCGNGEGVLFQTLSV